MIKNHVYYMTLALKEAAKARIAGELPIGCILVGGTKVIGRGQTSPHRKGSIVAHGELMMLLKAKKKIYSCERPLVLYTTLEPCLMCLGAAMQCGVDRIIYGMKCAPDGAISMGTTFTAGGHKLPPITGGVLEKECVEEFRRWPGDKTNAAGKYVREILEAYNES
jgi:tRNA(adenine34) deaminase